MKFYRIESANQTLDGYLTEEQAIDAAREHRLEEFRITEVRVTGGSRAYDYRTGDSLRGNVSTALKRAAATAVDGLVFAYPEGASWVPVAALSEAPPKHRSQVRLVFVLSRPEDVDGAPWAR